MAVAQARHRVTVDEYIRIVRDFGWESTELIAYAKAGVADLWLIDPRAEVGEVVRHRDPEGASYGAIDRFDVGENAVDLEVAAILKR